MEDIRVLQWTIIRLYELNQKRKQNEAEFSKQKENMGAQINSLMKERNLTQYEFETSRTSPYLKSSSAVYSCKLVQPQSVVYSSEKIREAFDKDFCNEVIDKQYIISDMDGLKTLLKKYGVNPKEFSKFLKIVETVNVGRLDQLYELGELKIEDMAGCYEIVKQKARWQIGAKAGRGDKN